MVRDISYAMGQFLTLTTALFWAVMAYLALGNMADYLTYIALWGRTYTVAPVLEGLNAFTGFPLAWGWAIANHLPFVLIAATLGHAIYSHYEEHPVATYISLFLFANVTGVTMVFYLALIATSPV
ncbi:MAG: hypothetical protein AAGF20_11420 [Pseudomonadota bacterium]